MTPCPRVLAAALLFAAPATAEIEFGGEVRFGLVHSSAGGLDGTSDGRAQTHPVLEGEVTIATSVTTDSGLTLGAGVTLGASTLDDGFRGRRTGGTRLRLSR